MSGHLARPFCVALLALRLSVALAEEPVDLQLLQPQQGVLLLRNGELIEGKITLAGDRYDVAVDDGEIHIKRSEVDFFCRDAAQCYQRKRSHIDADKIQDHLDLAEWCLRHDLVAEAKVELSQSAALDPSHPMVGLLERRIKLAAEEPASDPLPAAAVRPPTPAKQLERMARELPAGSFETFTTTIQPLLSSQCSTSGCHGPQAEGSLRLIHGSSGRPLTRRATLLNLSSVLAVIDHDEPSSSPLLTAPTGPHGSCKAAIFSQRDAARYRMLVNWVNRVAAGEDAGGASSADGAYRPGSPASRSAKRAALRRSEREAEAKAQGRHFPRNSAAAAAAEMPATTAKTQVPDQSPDVQPSGSASTQDPFDPEVFNRQAAGKSR
jgi:hypothetical protein